MKQAERITRALRGRWFGRNGVAPCPAHDDRHPSLSLADGDGDRLLVRCHAGCSFSDVYDALRRMGLLEGAVNYRPLSVDDRVYIRQTERERIERQEARARVCWRETLPIGGTIAEKYLRHRDITCGLPHTLRFHPECWHPSGARLPAMVALVEGVPHLAVHRTYLRLDGMGKAGDPAKAMLGAVAGGAVRLTAGGDKLVVCEGIETGLSLASGLLYAPATIWAALSTSGMKRLHLPDTPGRLTIAMDGDDAGREAGQVLAANATAAGWLVGMLAAPDGRDWNDILTANGEAA